MTYIHNALTCSCAFTGMTSNKYHIMRVTVTRSLHVHLRMRMCDHVVSGHAYRPKFLTSLGMRTGAERINIEGHGISNRERMS